MACPGQVQGDSDQREPGRLTFLPLGRADLNRTGMADDVGRFETLSTAECWRLLEAGTIGRVAWEAADGPEILPLTYAVHDGLIIFRTSAYGPLAELRSPRPVAFEIDAFDVVEKSGWSVTARGPSRAATRADELVELWSHEDPAPWAAGSRTLFIVIVPQVVTGRRVTAPSGNGNGSGGGDPEPQL